VDVVCPGCGYGNAEETLSGFCSTCDGRLAVERYEREDAAAVAARRSSWRARTRNPSESREAAAARQRRHRLLLDVAPSEPVPPSGADPWILGQEAVQLVRKVRSITRDRPRGMDLLDRIEVLIRWLATGPQDTA
jgi:uncharacterized Zn finger protein (UPF0148 family)